MPSQDQYIKTMIRSLLLAFGISLFAPSVDAHPHIFVDADGGYLFNDAGELVGVRVFWLYDEYSTLFLYDALDLDKDGDGELDEADLEKVRQGETTWDPEYEGDTYLWIAGQKQMLSRPLKTSARMVEGRIGVSFELHLPAPQNIRGRSASLKLYDPIYYYAYSILGEGRMFGNASGCHVSVNRFNPDEQTAELQKELSTLSRDEVPENLNIGSKFAEEIKLQCV